MYIIDNSPLSGMPFENSFPQCVACLLILLTLSFTKQKFLILMKSRLSIISLMDHASSVAAKKSSPYPKSSRFSPMLSSRSFIVFSFTFKTVTYLELIFVTGVRSVPTFISLLVDVQLFKHNLLKRLSLLYCIAFVPLSKIS